MIESDSNDDLHDAIASIDKKELFENIKNICQAEEHNSNSNFNKEKKLITEILYKDRFFKASRDELVDEPDVRDTIHIEESKITSETVE